MDDGIGLSRIHRDGGGGGGAPAGSEGQFVYVSGEAGASPPPEARVVTLFCPAWDPISLAHGLRCLCAESLDSWKRNKRHRQGCKEAFAETFSIPFRPLSCSSFGASSVHLMA